MTLLTERPNIGAFTAARGDTATLSEIFDAGVDNARYVSNLGAETAALEAAYDARIDQVLQATGQRLENPLRAKPSPRYGHFGPEQGEWDPVSDFQRALEDLAQARPEHRAAIGADRPVTADAAQRARQAEHRLSDLMSRREGVGKWAAAFGGGFRGMLEDPANVATGLIGPAGTVGTGARAVLWMGVKSGLANAAVEAASQPIVQNWRKRAGLDYGISHAAMDVAMAGMFGFGLDAGVRGAFRGVRMAAGGRTPEVVLDDAARAMPPHAIARKAVEGDPEALRRMANATGVGDDPAVRGAAAALDLDIIARMPQMDVDEGEHLSRLSQAMRHAIDPEREPPPGDAMMVPEARAPNLAHDAPAPHKAFAVEGKPVTFGDVPAAKLLTDASTFQFKSGGDAAGANGRLLGVERWDPVAAGRVVVYERVDGDLVIADGHQRLALAKRLEAAGHEPISLQAFTFREADGWDPPDVRALAAKKNLQEGTGTVTDAAKVIRERPDIIDKTVPLGSEAMRQARALSRLSDEAFGMVSAGVLPPNQAALVGDLVADKARHAGMIGDLAKAELDTLAQARLAIADMLQAGSRVETQLTLLGEMTSVHSLLPQRVRVLDAAMKAMRSDARVFGLLRREEGRIEEAGNVLAGDTNAQRAADAERMADLMERLAQSRGPVSAWLNDAAERLAGGEQLKGVSDQFVSRVRDALERDGLAGLMADGRDLELKPQAFVEPAGKDAQAQVNGLAGPLTRQADMFAVPEPKADIKRADADAHAADVLRACKG